MATELQPEQVILEELINRYARNRVAKSWIGSRELSEHSKIRRKLKRSREQLEQYLLTELGVEVHLD